MGYATTSTVYRWLHKLADAGEIEPAGEEKTA
jgi:DNA-binding PadR family transcriptional regulator